MQHTCVCKKETTCAQWWKGAITFVFKEERTCHSDEKVQHLCAKMKQHMCTDCTSAHTIYAHEKEHEW